MCRKSFAFRVLGSPGRDNALLVRIDSGQTIEHLLFDCGEGCLQNLSLSEIRSIDHLFFSHLHMDHVAGFDSFFRATYDRTSKPNSIWGPPGTAETLQHRFQGFLWNLHHGRKASWRVNDVDEAQVTAQRFELGEAFATSHDEGSSAHEAVLCRGVGYTVQAITMDHHTPSIAYVVRERSRRNVDKDRLQDLGLRPGPWLKAVSADDPADEADDIEVDGRSYSLAELRSRLVVETAGSSIAYLTDFLLDEVAVQRLLPMLAGCHTIVCESQYREADADLALKNRHMTSVQAARLAVLAGAEELVLFHVSDRYRPPEWLELLREAQSVFLHTRFAVNWDVVV